MKLLQLLSELKPGNIRELVRRRATRSYFASTCMHVAALALLFVARLHLVASAPEVTVEAVDTGDRVDEKVLVESTAMLTTEVQSSDHAGQQLSEGPVGGVSAAFSGSGIGRSTSRTVRVEAASQPGRATGPKLWQSVLPGHSEVLTQDYGAIVGKGEPAAPAANYEQALSRIAQELIRLMREEPVLVVWLFDESGSMRDDQAAIRRDINKVYQEIGLQVASSRPDKVKTKGKTQADPLVSAVVGFGEHIHPVIAKPTSDLRAVRRAIEELSVDESGIENTAAALHACLEEYRGKAKRQKRRLVFIIVTDESGDDWDHLEELIARVRESHSPVYVLGREAIFGYPWAHVRWVDPVYGLTHWLPISRGPETALPECLQWDGLHGRDDAFSSGAAPYELARLVSESGGIYFILPDDEQHLSGAGANEKRRLEYLHLLEYQPDLVTRREYEENRSASRLRSAVWTVIRTLNPHLDPELNLREWNYPIENAAFQKVGHGEFQKAVRAMVLLNQAVKLLDDVHPARAEEASQRWRANYDLLCAQCLAYRVRLFQFLLAIDQHVKAAPVPMTPKTNCWNVQRRRQMLPPDDEQVLQTNINLKELVAQEKRARELFQLVLTEHAGTPWARRAEYELGVGFGMNFVEGFADPRYSEVGKTIKLPKF
ncbi:MAG TPA: vWA domain-containing protein [Planctomycetaceae bacterium]|nr:vWA domain-containing protein [Planctomycetaceae bacterium]